MKIEDNPVIVKFKVLFIAKQIVGQIWYFVRNSSGQAYTKYDLWLSNNLKENQKQCLNPPEKDTGITSHCVWSDINLRELFSSCNPILRL